MTEEKEPVTVVPQFESLVGQSGVHVHDPVEDVQALLFTDQAVSPTPTDTDGFAFPVESAVEIDTSTLQTPVLLGIYVRDIDGDVLTKFDPDGERESLPPGDYLLELTGLGMKMYARTSETGFDISAIDSKVVIEFDGETTVSLGARSYHSQPARKLVTTSDPEDLMRAVSLFGNAMKTWSPERTFPSLRGHPPLLELEETCRIPAELSPPETDIELQIPSELEWLYPAVPLAFWLGATVTEGSPTLQVNGRRYPLGRSGGYEAETPREAYENHVKDILQFTFLFECAVRTEGFYEVELDVRRRIEAVEIPLDFTRLYEAPIADRVQTYLDLPYSFDGLSARIGRPGWRLTADVQPDVERASSMPFLARDLAVVRCPTETKLEETSKDTPKQMETVFSRTTSPDTERVTFSADGVASRASSSGNSADSSTGERLVGLPEADSMSQAWIGDGFAVGAAKTSTRSYLQRLESHANESPRISIDVVVNDEEMTDEASVSDIYGTRDHLNFDIQVQNNLTTEELASVFERDSDFVHYVGHVDREGFDCADGYLHANQLGTVGADTFVLNACASYKQGQLLVDRGAIAGVVTLEDVINSLATKVGKTIARLLNYGFPIGSATGLIQETIFTGSNYVVLGDSNAALAQSNVAIPSVTRVSIRGDGLFDVSIETFASWNYDIGSMYRPYLEGCECNYVVPGELDTWRVDSEALDEYLERYTVPIVGQGNLFWSDEITASRLREQLLSYS